jgi:hypothetical protein
MNNIFTISSTHQLSINNLNATSTTIFTNLNNFSTNGQLSINNLNATSTTLLNLINYVSTYSYTNIQLSLIPGVNGLISQVDTISSNTYLITPNNISLIGYNPTYSLGGGSLIGYCNTSGSILSTSAIIGDTVIRSAASNRLLLQSGASSAALYIDNYNNVVLDNPTTCLSTLNISGNTIINSGVLYIYNNPASNPGSNGYACLWNQAGLGPTLSGYQISLATGVAPTTERMRIDNNGNININNSLSVSGAINANGNSIVFPNSLSDYKLSLWGPNQYGFGIQGGEIKYITGGNHNFYYCSSPGGAQTKIFGIDSSGNASCTSYLYAGGLKLGGFDSGTT